MSGVAASVERDIDRRMGKADVCHNIILHFTRLVNRHSYIDTTEQSARLRSIASLFSLIPALTFELG